VGKQKAPEVKTPGGGIKPFYSDAVTVKRLGDNPGSAFSSTLAPEFRSELDNFGAISNTLGDELAGLRPLVAPGVSQLRTSRLNDLENVRSRTIGNLSENLARRRISGSSFANDALVRAESEFSRERDRINAESTLAELELTNQLLVQETEARLAGVERSLQGMEFSAEIAAGLSAQAAGNVQSAANLQAQLNAEAASSGGIGSVIGGLAGTAAGSFLGPLGASAGGAIGSSLFGGGGTTAAVRADANRTINNNPGIF
jgi:hypothetical protein